MHSIEETIIMMQAPKKWPAWPYLPLKRKESSSMPTLGVLVHDSDFPVKPIVYLMNLFAPVPTSVAKFEAYATFEDLTADGWLVD